MNINKKLEEIISDHRKELYGAKYELADNKTKFRLQQLILEMINDAVDKSIKDNDIDFYEVRTDDGDYSPTEQERFLIKDFFEGFLSDLDQEIKTSLGETK